MIAFPDSRWDVFCHVVDNFGDIGVCWRLARQLADEHGLAVRLWVDDLTVFRQLCPEIRADPSGQTVQGVEVEHWCREHDFADTEPGDVVVETFACRLPEAFEAAMARRDPQPVWINLDHLSAEAWVAEYHALPSPHPRLPLTKHFFFPGFSERTGGLLRESDLTQRRQAFAADPAARERFLARLGVPDVAPFGTDTLLVSLFGYENVSLASLLDAWSHGRRPVLCLAPPGRHLPDLERFAQWRLAVGEAARAGRLELRLIPFVAQPDYDRLLWSCDLNFVRGEDSFVRAQWAARPMFWHAYPQEDEAHHRKLAAFLDLYCAGLPGPAASALREFSLAWNGAAPFTGRLWDRCLDVLPALREHAGTWREKLAKQGDLASRLVQFCRSRLIMRG